MWKALRRRAMGDSVAIRNARQASLVLARRRKEREEVEAFLAASATRFEQPLGA